MTPMPLVLSSGQLGSQPRLFQAVMEEESAMSDSITGDAVAADSKKFSLWTEEFFKDLPVASILQVVEAFGNQRNVKLQHSAVQHRWQE